MVTASRCSMSAATAATPDRATALTEPLHGKHALSTHIVCDLYATSPAQIHKMHAVTKHW